MLNFYRQNSNSFKRQYSTPTNQQLPLDTATAAATTSTSTSTASTTASTMPPQTLAKKTIWSSMSRCKKVFSVYVGTVLCAYIYNTYKDGQQALFDHRLKRQLMCINNPVELLKPTNVIRDEEFNAVYNGCRNNSEDRFFTYVFYPYTVVTSIIPFVVTILNSKS